MHMYKVIKTNVSPRPVEDRKISVRARKKNINVGKMQMANCIVYITPLVLCQINDYFQG